MLIPRPRQPPKVEWDGYEGRKRHKQEGTVLERRKPSEDTILKRVALLYSLGYIPEQIDTMKNTRLYDHLVVDNKGVERLSTAAKNMIARRRRLIARTAEKEHISEEVAVEVLREEAAARYDDWVSNGFSGFDPEDDPIYQMGYKKYA